MRGVAVVLLLLGPGAAHAQLKPPTRPMPEAVCLHAGSWHDRGDYDNANLGLGLLRNVVHLMIDQRFVERSD